MREQAEQWRDCSQGIHIDAVYGGPATYQHGCVQSVQQHLQRSQSARLAVHRQTPEQRSRPISTERAPRALERMVTRQESVGEFPAVFDRQAGDIKVVIEMDS